MIALGCAFSVLRVQMERFDRICELASQLLHSAEIALIAHALKSYGEADCLQVKGPFRGEGSTRQQRGACLSVGLFMQASSSHNLCSSQKTSQAWRGKKAVNRKDLLSLLSSQTSKKEKLKAALSETCSFHALFTNCRSLLDFAEQETTLLTQCSLTAQENVSRFVT